MKCLKKTRQDFANVFATLGDGITLGRLLGRQVAFVFELLFKAYVRLNRVGKQLRPHHLLDSWFVRNQFVLRFIAFLQFGLQLGFTLGQVVVRLGREGEFEQKLLQFVAEIFHENVNLFGGLAHCCLL